MKLIFVHGSGADHATWGDVASRFPEVDAVDLPGHPEGEALPSVAAYARWLEERIRTTADGPVIAVGHSLGGAIVLSAALDAPELIAGIVLVGSGARLRVRPALMDGLADPAGRDALFERFLETLHMRMKPALAAALSRRSRAIGPRVMENDLRACNAFDVMERLGALSVPLLAICGKDDVMTPPKYSEYLASAVPDGRAVIIPGATHMLPAEKPDAVADAVEAFARELAPETR